MFAVLREIFLRALAGNCECQQLRPGPCRGFFCAMVEKVSPRFAAGDLAEMASRTYVSVAMTWKNGGREPPGCLSSRSASIVALIIFPASIVSIISPFFGTRSLSSEKRSRDPSRQLIVISHVAIRATSR
jgi:hypothetical protein